ncbi:uncharacterized protein LOC144113890 isoform X3 [Amblyomma americanum]
MSRFLKHSKVFDDSKGRFFLVLLTEASDERLSKLSLSITDGNSVWKAATSFEESCGSLKSRREENVKHLMKRISNCRLESIDDAEELTVTLVPPGKTYELKFKKSADHSVIFYLVILLHNVDSKVPSLVPLFQNTMPRLDALKMVYRGIHDTSWSLQQ